MFGQPRGSPDIDWYEIPTKRGLVPHPFMLPHVWFHSLRSKCPDRFAKPVLGDAGACAAFWTKMVGTEFVQKHPILKREHYSQTIPIGLYGDA